MGAWLSGGTTRSQRGLDRVFPASLASACSCRVGTYSWWSQNFDWGRPLVPEAHLSLLGVDRCLNFQNVILCMCDSLCFSFPAL